MVDNMAAEMREELGVEGRRHLDATITAAFHILYSMNDELCNPALWSAIDPSSDPAAGALDESRVQFKSAVAALRAVLAAVPVAAQGGDGSEGLLDQSEMERIELRAAHLKQELANKNKHLKVLIDQLRELICDITMWQSPCSM